jgi:site-specific DNA recombinase
MVQNFLMSVAQCERETVVERTRDAMRHKRDRGERLGKIRYGFDVSGEDGKTLVPNPEEQGALALMVELDGRGWTLRRIARELDSRGYRPKGGGPAWGHSTVGGILGRSGAGSGASGG